MNGLTTVTTKGQVTIPESVRQALGINIGDKVSFKKLQPASKEAIIKIIPINVIDKLSGSLSSSLIQSNFKKARKESGKLLMKKYKLR